MARGTSHRVCIHQPRSARLYFDAGYPNGHDQFLSMQGASWAVMALSYALEPARPWSRQRLPETEPTNVEPWVETMIFGTRDDVRRLLDGGLSANAATKSGGTTALMMAAPDVDKMTLLLDRGAEVNARANSRFSALMVAAQYQEGDAAINLLLDRGAQVAAPASGAPVFNANPFFLASYAGNARSLKRLLAAGGKLDEAMIAIGTSRTTPMLGAFKFGDIEVARTLLDLGAPVDFADGNGITMLGRAALNNDIEHGAHAHCPRRHCERRRQAGDDSASVGGEHRLRRHGDDRVACSQSGAKADVRNKDGSDAARVGAQVWSREPDSGVREAKATN